MALLYYRQEASAKVVAKLVEAISKALMALELNPASGSPTLGKEIGVEGLRTWRVDGFPLTFWYFERDDHVDVARLIGQRQDQAGRRVVAHVGGCEPTPEQRRLPPKLAVPRKTK